MRLYVYEPMRGTKDWDDAINSNRIRVIAIILGDVDHEVEAIAEYLYGDPDRFGWCYSAPDMPIARLYEMILVDSEVDKIKNIIRNRNEHVRPEHRLIFRRVPRGVIAPLESQYKPFGAYRDGKLVLAFAESEDALWQLRRDSKWC